MTVTLQSMTALKKGNDTRYRRARERRAVCVLPGPEGRAVVAALLEEPPSWLLTCPVGDLLQWPQRMGRELMRKTLRKAGFKHWINEERQIRDLTARERHAIAASLRKTR